MDIPRYGSKQASESRYASEAKAEQGLSPGEIKAMTPEEISQAFHILRVSQIELEKQNEELRVIKSELEASKSRYLNLYNMAPVGYFTLDEHGLILEANLTAANLLGTVSSAVVNEKIARFILSEDLDIYYQNHRRLSQTGLPQIFELRMVRLDGTFFWAHWDSTAAQSADGHLVFNKVVSDVSERKKIIEDNLQLDLQLRRSQTMESLGRLAGGVAHDINNVLSAILGLASAHLEIQPKDSSVYDVLDTIAKAAVRGGETVKSLLTFARQGPSEEVDIDFNAIIQEEVRLLKSTTLSKVRLEMDLDAELRHIRGDASALTLALMNLCINAVDALSGNGTLCLRTRNRGPHWVEVVVEDTGSGMSAEVLERAIDPFFSTKDVGKGTGLGLSIVYSTIEAHQGHLTIHSEPGLGTRIEMQFPASGTQVAPPREMIEPLREQPNAALNVLLVDDDELVRNSMRALLTILGHKTNLAESGEEALAQLEDGLDPDVVILDINMPGMGGIGALPRIRVLRPQMPVMISTGRVDQVVLNLIAAHPFTTLLPKPFSLGQLREHIEALRPKATISVVPRHPGPDVGASRKDKEFHSRACRVTATGSPCP